MDPTVCPTTTTTTKCTIFIKINEGNYLSEILAPDPVFIYVLCHTHYMAYELYTNVLHCYTHYMAYELYTNVLHCHTHYMAYELYTNVLHCHTHYMAYELYTNVLHIWHVLRF